VTGVDEQLLPIPRRMAAGRRWSRRGGGRFPLWFARRGAGLDVV